MSYKEKFRKLVEKADIGVNGERPWDIQVHNDKFYKRVFTEGTLGLGESYMDGWWDCEKLDEMMNKVLRADLRKHMKFQPAMILGAIRSLLFNLQSKARAFVVGEEHYDIGNDLFKEMLDERMIYTCGYWREADNLAEAQEDKMDLICRKLGIKKGMSVLDIGCGWGGFAKYAAEEYGAKVVGVTVSKEQAELAREKCGGLPVEIKLQDYRDEKGKYDRVLSVGMFSHIGHKNHRQYMEVTNKLLKKDGLSFIHAVGRNSSVTFVDPWIDKYIFPNGNIASVKQIASAIEGSLFQENLFVIEDLHNLGTDYDKTLMAWYENINNSWNKLNYGKRFQRMWNYYLLTCAGAFRARELQLWQLVLSNRKDQYRSIR